MRGRVAGGVASAALALALSAGGSGAAGVVTRAQVELMPLPRAAYGALPAALTLDRGSGWTSNSEAADNDLDTRMTAARLAAIGRTTGYDVEFDDLAGAMRRGRLVDADSSVDVFRTAAGAARFLAVEAAEFRHADPRHLQPGMTVDRISFFGVPLRDALGVHVRIRFGSLTLWETAAEFRSGAVAAAVGLGRTDERNVNAEVVRLARALAARIDGVLAGRVHDRPLATGGPKLGGLGRPAGGPDLAAMALRGDDFSPAVTPRHEGYQRNPDDVAEYVREFGGAVFEKTLLSAVHAEVELRPSPKNAADDLALVRLALGGSQGRDVIRRAIASELPAKAKAAVEIGALSSRRVAAGDRSVAFEARFTVNGIAFGMVICLVQRGPVVETLTLAAFPSISPSTTTKLARRAAARIDAALHR